MKSTKVTKNPIDKSEYRATLLVLMEAITLESRINQLSKIWGTSEDEFLRNQLWVVLEMLRYLTTLPKQNQPKVMDFAEPRVSILCNHCFAAMASTKPQWQIIAESNGWRQY